MKSAHMTLGVLAGAYRGRGEDRTLLTHSAELDSDGFPVKTLCKRVNVDHLVDANGMEPEERISRPTCKACAAKWDKLAE